MTKKLNDILSLKPTGLDNVTKVNVSVSCELMKNHAKASPVDPEGILLVAQDSLGQAMVFSVGSDQRLRLLRFSSGSEGGYEEIQLWKSFDADYNGALALDVIEDSSGRISLAVAMERRSGDGSDLFLASMLSGDVSRTDWKNLKGLCAKISGVDKGFIADHMRLGSSDDGKAPLLVCTGKSEGAETYYQVVDGKSASHLELPENVSKPSDVELGYAFGQRAKYFLYKQGGSQTLASITYPDPPGDFSQGSQTYDFSPGNQEIPAEYRDREYHCMATAAGTNRNPISISSDLYVGTDKGILLFKGGKIRDGFQAVAADIADVHQLYVTEDQHSISVWAIASPNRLYYIYGKKGSTYAWNAPILFDTSTLHIAPLRVRTRKTNELYLVDQKRNLRHIWQDAASTIWRSRTIKVKNEDYVLDFDSYTTQIRLSDQNGSPLAGQTVELTSSEWLYAAVNGLTYSLDVDTPAQVQTDGLGGISIVQTADGIAPPILHVDASFLDKALNIYPNGRIVDGLSKIKKGDDLANARGSDGKPVLDKPPTKATLDGVAGNVDHLSTAGTQHLVGARAEGDLFVSLSEKDAKHTGALTAAHLPDNFAVGMTLKDGQWRPSDPNAEDGFVKSGNIVDDIVTFVGDGFRWLEHAFEDGIKLFEKGVTYLKEGVSFVLKKVGDALHFVLSIADKVLTLVLDTFVKVFKALNWVLNLIGIDLSALLRWLGHLFGWDDIWETHKVISSCMSNGLNYAVGKLDGAIDDLKAFVAEKFDSLEKTIDDLILPAGMANQSLAQHGSTSDPLSSASGSWIFNQIAHSGLFGGGGGLTPDSNDPFSAFLRDVVEPTVEGLIRDLADVAKDLQGGLSGDTEAVYKLLPDLVKLALDPLRTIALGFLDFIEDLAEWVKDGLTGTLDIPFLGSFYKFITELLGDEEELTVFNGVALVLAVPFTFAYKLANGGDAPFKDGDHGMKDPNLFANLFSGGSPFALSGASPVAEYYSRIGGGFAALAAIPASIMSLLSTADSKTGKTLSKISRGLSVAVALLTFPIQKDKQPDSSYGFKVTAWCLSSLKNIGYPFIGKEKVRQGLSSATNVVILCLALPADIIAEESAWTYGGDILSNVGGAVANGALAASQAEIAVVGAGIAYFGAIVFFASAIASDTVVHIVNPAG